MHFDLRSHARILSFAALVFIGTSPVSAHEAQEHAKAAPAPSASAKYEIRFLTEMIDHHAMAVHMARACSSKAEHPELRQLCEQIMTAQHHEIATMQSWLKSWYGITHEPDMDRAHMRQMEQLEALSGREFEIAFLTMMVEHHRQAVRESDQCLRRATHAELKELCQNIHTTQQAEIQQMKGWLCQWYAKCR